MDRRVLVRWIVAAMVAGALARIDFGSQASPRFAISDVQQPEAGIRIASASDGWFERARIAAHLARVEARLRAADVSSLSSAQRAARARNLDALCAYRQRGQFPHNHVVAARRSPVFVDEHGTHCAVGALIAQSGHQALAQRIARTRNLATIDDLSGDPELQSWLDAAGISLREAALIQPWYGEYPSGEGVAGSYYDTATIAATGVGGSLMAWNLLAAPGHRDLAGALGLTAGLAQMGLGFVGWLDQDTAPEIETSHIVINAAVGMCTAILGLRSLVVDDAPPGGDANLQASSSRTPAWRMTPWLARGGEAGVDVALRF